jgi:hypothetical protein
MSDPYHTYENHNSQINVFHIKEPLKGSLTEKDKQMHKMAYLFNVKDPQKPEINFPKINIKIIRENIYLSDTIEIVLQKISESMNISKNEIYAWIDHKNEKKSLLYTKPFGINYDDLEDCKFMNPYLDKSIDDRFVNSDGSIKRNGLTYLDNYKILNNQFVNDIYHIYFTTLQDVKDYSKNIFKEDEKLIENGYLKKYFPLIDEPINKTLSEKIEIIEKQKNILNEFNENPVDIRPIHLVYENRNKNILIDLFKIFQEYEVSLEVPMIKIQTDTYMDSYIKFYKEGINTSYLLSKEKTITLELFEKWNKNIYLSDGFSRPKSIDKNNSLTFTIYDNKSKSNIQMILYIDGKVKIYSERLTRLEKFTDNIIQGYLRKANGILRNINKNLIISIPEILKQPIRIDISSIYEISDYHLLSLKKLFGSFYTEFIILNDEDNKLHLLYNKCDDFENIKYITDTITLCKRRAIDDKKILELLSIRYGLTQLKSKEYLDEWINININNPIKYREEIQNISIIIEKVLDRIKISFYNLSNYNNFHECIDIVNKIMNIYKLKRVEKRKDLPKEINDLFKKQTKKNIVTKQPEKKPEQSIEFFEPEPEPVSETTIPESETTDIILEGTDEVNLSDDDESDDESDDSDSEDEYDDIDDELAGMKNLTGGSNLIDSDESQYPNARYYIKRLEIKDPRLIKYKSKAKGDGYAAKCQAAQDKQPIALTRDELDEIDEKTGFKNLGISYSKPIEIKGGDRGEIFYICPKFWDRKNQIPIDPKSKYHPIEKDEEGNFIEWKQFVWSKEYKNSDGEYYILERSGRGANKSDNSSYWNKDKKKDDIDNYQVQLIHDDVHPELLPLPCCGKKQYNIKFKDVYVLIKDKKTGKNNWMMGEIGDKIETTNIELEKLNTIGECKISIPSINNKKKIVDTFHISQIKGIKGHNVGNSISKTEFPLKENKYGEVNEILKNIFYMKPNSPLFKKNIDDMTNNGFYRVGVLQDSDSFLRCINLLSSYLIRENTSKNVSSTHVSLEKFKKKIIEGLDKLTDKDILMIGDGSFVQYFRSEIKYEKRNYDKLLISDVKSNFKNYLYSEEPKDEKLLISLLMKCSMKKDNKLFNGKQINILVLSETYEKLGEEIINTKLNIIEPLGGLKIYNDIPFLLVYKKDDYYESLMYYYRGEYLSSIDNIKDENKPKIKNTLYHSGVIAEIKSIKDDIINIEYENKDTTSIPLDEHIKYDLSIIYHIITEFINDCKSKSIHNKKEIIQFEDLDFIMNEKLNCSILEGYYDNYHKLIGALYKKKEGSLKIPVFFKPRNKDDIDFPLKKIKSLDKYSLGFLIRIYNQIDKYINELYSDKYLFYLTDKSKILVNDFNLMIGLFMENGFIIPLKNKKYNESVYKYPIIKGSSILSIQNDVINPILIRNKTDSHFHKYNENMNNIYICFSELYDNIMRNDNLKRDVKKIVNHPIKLTIHKRWDLYDLLKEIYNEKEYKNLKLFIEYLIIHDLEDLQKILFQNYSSLKDYKLNIKSDTFIILNMKEFLTESYLEYFEKHSDYIRKISYYENTNPNINKILLKREFIEKPVSSYSKYPNTLKKIFGRNITIYKNILNDDKNDINIVSRLLDDISPENIRSILTDSYSLDDDSYKLHNDLLDNLYKDNRELISNIIDKFYKLSLIDYEILSEELGIGFVLFSNRYSNDKQRYKTHMIVHKDLKDDSEDDIKILCLYEDLSGEISENSECKPISIKDILIHTLGDLKKNREFNRLYLKS